MQKVMDRIEIYIKEHDDSIGNHSTRISILEGEVKKIQSDMEKCPGCNGKLTVESAQKTALAGAFKTFMNWVGASILTAVVIKLFHL